MNRFILSLIIVFLSGSAFAGKKPVLWNMDQLAIIKQNGPKSSIYKSCISNADKFLSEPYLAITDKKKSFASDKHYYSSLAPYWWPDPQNPGGKYIRKDGLRNPELNDYDSSILSSLRNRLKALSIAYYLAGENNYREAFLKQLRVFFLDPDTYMYPNLEYAQVIPGYNNNRGRGAGVIAAEYFLDILDSYRLVNVTKPIDYETDRGIKKWFSDFLTWMLTSEIGKEEREGNGNIPLFYDEIALDIALFVDNNTFADELTRDFRKNRLDVQIMADGRQPYELVRTKAYDYSIYNLTHIVDFCLIQESRGNRYYKKNKNIIDSAFLYLIQFIGNQEAFEYQEISSWEECEEKLKRQVLRLKRLRPKRNRIYDYNHLSEGLRINKIDHVLN